MEQQARSGGWEAVIFDLDGVITDTAEYHYLGWQRLADEEDIPFDRETNEQLRGVSRRDSLKIILGDREVTEEQFDEMTDRKNRYYVEYLDRVSPSDTLPGARELVEECKARGVKVAIASSSRNAKRVLENLEMTDDFEAITDGNDAQRAKPAPDLFVHAAGQLGVEPTRCVVIEDAASGVEAANAADMRSVGVGPADRFEAADLRYDTVADIDVDEVLAPRG